MACGGVGCGRGRWMSIAEASSEFRVSSIFNGAGKNQGGSVEFYEGYIQAVR